MRVALITGAARPLVNFRGPLITSIVAAGHEMLALSPNDHEGIPEAMRERGATWHEVPFERAGTNPFGELVLLKHLRNQLRHQRSEVVISYTVKGALWGSLAARAARVPKIYGAITGLGHLFSDTGRSGQLRRAVILPLMKLALSGCDRVFFQNPDDIDEFVDRKLVRRDKTVLVAGSGVDLERFPAHPLPDGPTTFVFVGRFLKEKGLVELFDAVQLLRDRGYQPTVRIAGRVDPNPSALSADYVERRASELEIEVAGWTEQIQELLNECHVLVLPSYREGTPRSCLEAMATGRALIVTDVPGCREVIDSERNGLLVPVRDPGALADAMARMIDDPDMVATMATQGLDIARKKYDVHLVNAQMMQVMAL